MGIKRVYTMIVLLGAVAAFAFGQDENPQLSSMQQTFENANQEVKLRLLNRVWGRDDASEFGPLYGQALEYVVNNAGNLDTSSTLQDMARIGIGGVEQSGYSAALDALWALFRNTESTELRVRVINASAAVGADDEEAKAVLNRWVRERHDDFAGNGTLDTQVMEAAVRAMGQLGDPMFYPTLLNAVILQYDRRVVQGAQESIGSLQGSVAELAAEDFDTRSPSALEQAVGYLLGSDQLSGSEKSELARAAMVEALSRSTTNVEQLEALRQVRYQALSQIVSSGYGEATSALIRHFNRTVQEYDAGRVQKSRILDAIDGLGAMGTEAASARLSRYLELLNTRTENDRPTDTQLTLAVVRNLGRLSQEVAYNPLFYASLLEYPARVQTAIEEALTAISE